jgi:hypothetical protein
MRSANFKVQCKEAARVKPSLASTELNREGKLHDSMQKDGTANHRTNSRCIGRVASLAAEFTATRVKPGGRRTAAKAKASRCTQGCSKGNTELKSWAEPGSKSFTTQFTGDGAGKTAPPPNNLIGKHELRDSIEKRATRSHRVALDFFRRCQVVPTFPHNSQVPTV